MSFTDEFVGSLIDRIAQPLFTRIDTMLQQITDLQTAVTELTNQVGALKAQDDTLKAAYSAAVASNATLTTQVADLTQKLSQAQSGALSADDTTALTNSLASIKTATQTLSDTAQADATSN